MLSTSCRDLLLIGVGVMAFGVVTAARSGQLGSGDRAEQVEFRWGVKIPLRDGINLNATLYLPKEQTAPKPCVVTMTPYVADTYHDRGMYFASHGIPFAVVDVRGRGNSEGSFHPMIQEAHDGYDVVEWLARQKYCNGKVSMWGGSYAGYVQWATAKETPPHLATIVPVAAPFAGTDFPMRSNIHYPYLVQWLTYTTGRTLQAQIFADGDFWSALYRQWHVSGRPFRELDTMAGNASAVFQEWLAHPEPDAYWDNYNPTAEQYARLQIPILTITGSYDDDQPGALEHYRRHMSSASALERARHYLVIGPWDHAGTRTPRAEVGGVKFGPASLLDIPQLHVDWYAWTMAEGRKPAFLQAQVAYYVMGAERWRYADSLEQVTSKSRALYLSSAANANDPLCGGQLGESAHGQPDHYRYDPRDVAAPEVEAEARVNPSSMMDQSVFLALRGRELVYHSEPFKEDTEISGFFKLSAWIALDTPDTDLYVSVFEILPDGSSIWLSADAVRARYRESLRSPKLIVRDERLRYDFAHFTFIARTLRQGSRLRLVVSPMGGRLAETTFAEKNYNSGGRIASESAQDGRAVTVRLYHDTQHPSALYVPIGRPAAD